MAQKPSGTRAVWELSLASAYFAVLAASALVVGVSLPMSLAFALCAVALGVCAFIFRLTVKNRRALNTAPPPR